jgi:hypothetical protein
VDSITGTLSLRLKAKRNGKVRFAVRLRDSGGVEYGGIDDFVQELLINVMPVNDAPSFKLLAPTLFLREQPVQQAIKNANIASDISKGAWGESHQHVSFIVAVLGGPDGLLVSQPIASPDGDRVLLELTIAQHRFGNVTLNITILDDGGDDLGGADRQTYALRVNVEPVNDPPTLTLVSSKIFVNRNSGCSGLGEYGGRRTRVVGTQVQCSAVWDDLRSPLVRTQILGAGKCDHAGPVRLHELLGFVQRFSLGPFEDGLRGCGVDPVSNPRIDGRLAVCCSDMCVNAGTYADVC